MDRAQAFREFLESEGYRPNIDDDGDVIFKVESGTYYLFIDPKDDEYVQVVYPRFWSLNSEQERAAALAAASNANRSCKGAKVFVGPKEDNVFATIEFFAPTVEQACSVLPRSIRALRFAALTFAKSMRGDD